MGWCGRITIGWVWWWRSRCGSILVPIGRTSRCLWWWRMVGMWLRSCLLVITRTSRLRRLVVPTRSWWGVCLYRHRSNGRRYYSRFQNNGCDKSRK